MSKPLTIQEAEQLLSRAWGRQVTIKCDPFGYFTNGPNGEGYPFYEAYGIGPLDQPHVTRITPMIGDWPQSMDDDDDDIIDCQIQAENDRDPEPEEHWYHDNPNY